MRFNIYDSWVVKELYNNSFVIVISNWITHHHSIIYTKEKPVPNAYIIRYGDTIELILLYIIYQSTELFPGIKYVVCHHYSFDPLQLLNYWSSMEIYSFTANSHNPTPLYYILNIIELHMICSATKLFCQL